MALDSSSLTILDSPVLALCSVAAAISLLDEMGGMESIMRWPLLCVFDVAAGETSAESILTLKNRESIHFCFFGDRLR